MSIGAAKDASEPDGVCIMAHYLPLVVAALHHLGGLREEEPNVALVRETLASTSGVVAPCLRGWLMAIGEVIDP